MSDAVFDTLGFHWDRSKIPSHVPVHSVERACFRFHKMLPEVIWDASMLEGNPFTFPEVQTLLDGVTVGGRKISDEQQVLNLAKSAKRLVALVKSRQFVMDKRTFTELHGLVANEEALEWGLFRGEGDETQLTPDVSLGGGRRYTPPPTEPGAPALNRVFRAGVEALNTCPPFERGLAFFLFGALQQFFFEGNKRTSRFMMNGVLMANGIDAISVPAAKAAEFNQAMVRYFVSKDGTEMMAFLTDFHPDARDILQPSGGLAHHEGVQDGGEDVKTTTLPTGPRSG